MITSLRIKVLSYLLTHKKNPYKQPVPVTAPGGLNSLGIDR